MHLMEELCRPKQIAVVMVLQSQLHKVNGRRAGDHTMRPSSSTVEDLGMNTGPARSRAGGNNATLHHRSKCVEQETGTQSTSTFKETIWNTIGTRSRFFLCGHHFIKFFLADCPLNILWAFCAKPENGLIGRVPFVLGACLKNLALIST